MDINVQVLILPRSSGEMSPHHITPPYSSVGSTRLLPNNFHLDLGAPNFMRFGVDARAKE